MILCQCCVTLLVLRYRGFESSCWLFFCYNIRWVTCWRLFRQRWYPNYKIVKVWWIVLCISRNFAKRTELQCKNITCWQHCRMNRMYTTGFNMLSWEQYCTITYVNRLVIMPIHCSPCGWGQSMAEESLSIWNRKSIEMPSHFTFMYCYIEALWTLSLLLAPRCVPC